MHLHRRVHLVVLSRDTHNCQVHLAVHRRVHLAIDTVAWSSEVHLVVLCRRPPPLWSSVPVYWLAIILTIASVHLAVAGVHLMLSTDTVYLSLSHEYEILYI